MAGSPPDVEALDLDGLNELVLRLLEENAALKAENAALRDEIARLKGLKGRPKIKPSAMDEKAATRGKTKARRRAARRGRGAKRLAIDEDRVIAAPHPPGSRFKGNSVFNVSCGFDQEFRSIQNGPRGSRAKTLGPIRRQQELSVRIDFNRTTLFDPKCCNWRISRIFQPVSVPNRTTDRASK